MLGAGSIDEAARPYANPLIFLFMGGFMIALAMQRWDLHRRIAFTLELDRIAGGRTLIERELEKLGPLSRPEKRVGVVFGCVVLLWMTRPPSPTSSLSSSDLHGSVMGFCFVRGDEIQSRKLDLECNKLIGLTRTTTLADSRPFCLLAVLLSNCPPQRPCPELQSLSLPWSF